MRRMVLLILAAIVCAAPLAQARAQAQREMRMTIEGENPFLLEEFILVLSEEDGAVVVSMTPPEGTLKEPYEEVDFKSGDVIKMMNGKRVKTTAEIREIYEKLEPGDEIKFGVKRGEEMFIVKFPRTEKSGQQGGVIMKTITIGGEEDEDGEDGDI